MSSSTQVEYTWGRHCSQHFIWNTARQLSSHLYYSILVVEKWRHREARPLAKSQSTHDSQNSRPSGQGAQVWSWRQPTLTSIPPLTPRHRSTQQKCQVSFQQSHVSGVSKVHLWGVCDLSGTEGNTFQEFCVLNSDRKQY